MKKRYGLYANIYEGIDEELEDDGYWVKYDHIEPLLKAVARLLECKGRFHTEQNFKALAEEWGKIK